MAIILITHTTPPRNPCSMAKINWLASTENATDRMARVAHRSEATKAAATRPGHWTSVMPQSSIASQMLVLTVIT